MQLAVYYCITDKGSFQLDCPAYAFLFSLRQQLLEIKQKSTKSTTALKYYIQFFIYTGKILSLMVPFTGETCYIHHKKYTDSSLLLWQKVLWIV